MENEQDIKIILFGGSEHLLDFSVWLAENDVTPVIFTAPVQLDEKINAQGSLKENLDKQNISYVSTDKLEMSDIKPHINGKAIGLSIGARWIFKKDIIELFQGRLFNIHSTRLPLFRGGAAYTWQILSQDKRGGITIHKIAQGVDTGGIVLQKEFTFPDTCQIPADFYSFRKELINDLLKEFLTKAMQGEDFQAVEQDESASVYWPRLNTEMHGLIDWSWTAQEISLFINAFDDPYQGASAFINEKRVYLKKCSLEKIANTNFHPFQAGLVVRKHKGLLYIAARGGLLAVQDIFDGDNQPFQEQINLGDRFSTSVSYLEKAREFRARYNARGLIIKN